MNYGCPSKEWSQSIVKFFILMLDLMDSLFKVIIIKFNVQKVLGHTLKGYLDGRIQLSRNANTTSMLGNMPELYKTLCKKTVFV